MHKPFFRRKSERWVSCGGTRSSYVVQSFKNQLDGIPFFLNYGAPRARAFGPRGAPLLGTVQ